MTENPPQHPGAGGTDSRQAQGQPPFGAPQPPFGAPQPPFGAPQPPYGAAEQQPYPAPGGPGSRYGTTAYDPGAVGQEMAEPKGWARLKTLTLVSFGIHLVSGIVGLAGLNEDLIRETAAAELEAQGMAASEEIIEQSVQLGMAFGMATMIVSIVLGIILYLLVFLGLRGGKNWARILGTVLAAVGTLYTLVGLAGIGITLAISPVIGTLTLILSVLFVLVNIWWIVTAFSKDVNAYMRARSGR